MNHSTSAHEMHPDTIIGVRAVAGNWNKAFVSEPALRQSAQFFQVLERVDSGVDFALIAGGGLG